MTLRILTTRILALLFAACVSVSAQSQPPSPSEREAGKNQQQLTEGENRTPDVAQPPSPTTALGAATGNQAAAPPATATPNQQSENRNGGAPAQRWYEDWGTWSDIIVAFASVVMAVYTWRLWVVSDLQRQTLDATLAATMETERAYLDVSLVHVPEGVLNLKPNGTPSVMLRIQNDGRTPAQLAATVVGLVAGPGPLPPTPAYQSSVIPVDQGGGYVMPGSCSYIVKELSPMAAEIYEAIEDKRLTLWLMGYVRYSDKFGRSFQRGFIRCYVPNRTPEQWIMDSTPGYDYDRLTSKEQA